MAKPEWGVKRTCLACATRFYDMRKDPIVCPSCGVKFDPEAVFRPRRPRVQAEEAAPVKVVPKVDSSKDPEDELAALAGGDLPEVEDDDDDDIAATDLDDDEDDDDVTVIAPKVTGDDND